MADPYVPATPFYILTVRVLGAVFRALLNVGMTWLVAKGVLTKADADSWTAEAAFLLATIVLTVVWSVWQKYRSDWRWNKTVTKAIEEAEPGTPIEVVKVAARTNKPVTEVAVAMSHQTRP